MHVLFGGSDAPDPGIGPQTPFWGLFWSLIIMCLLLSCFRWTWGGAPGRLLVSSWSAPGRLPDGSWRAPGGLPAESRRLPAAPGGSWRAPGGLLAVSRWVLGGSRRLLAMGPPSSRQAPTPRTLDFNLRGHWERLETDKVQESMLKYTELDIACVLLFKKQH